MSTLIYESLRASDPDETVLYDPDRALQVCLGIYLAQEINIEIWYDEWLDEINDIWDGHMLFVRELEGGPDTTISLEETEMELAWSDQDKIDQDKLVEQIHEERTLADPGDHVSGEVIDAQMDGTEIIVSLGSEEGEINFYMPPVLPTVPDLQED